MNLPSNELHIWQTNTNITNQESKALLNILSEDEVNRAMRFKFDKHRNAFIKARHTLRKILSNYINLSSEKIKFTKNKYGKPFLLDKKIYFNLSHTDDIALYAISHVELMGIDIEYIDRKINIEGIYHRFFSEEECALIDLFLENKRAEAFFKIWTAKEAFIKAIGEGLSYPLKSFDIGLDNGKVFLKSINNDKEPSKSWSVFSLPISNGYESSVAIKSDMPNVQLFKI